MTENEYAATIARQRTIAGRMHSGGYIATITGPDGYHLDSPRFDTEAKAQEWAAKFIAAKTAGKVLPARPVPANADASNGRPVAQLDRQATRVANLIGLSAPRATGRCHYCGLPLTNGRCEECV